MNSERQKREQEVEKFMRGASLSREADVEFQEKVRKTASAIFEEETRKVQQNERTEKPKRAINIATAGLWLIVLGVAGFVFWMPALGGVAVACGIAAIIWDTFLKRHDQKRSKMRDF